MDVQRYAFLVATLGEDGAQALAKAAERVPTLASVLVPRAILAWLQVQDDEFEGELPGLQNTYLSFSKSQGTYTGTVSVQDTSYGFEAATPMHLAASIGIALGVDAEGIDPQLRDHDLQRLGKSVDLLCKARKAVQDVSMVKRQLDPGLGYTFTHEHTNAPWGVRPDGNKKYARMTRIFAHPPPSASGEWPEQHRRVPGGEKAPFVGYAAFTHLPDGKTIMPESVNVKEEHQRQGLASAIYAHAEKLTGKKVVPSPEQSDEGRALSGRATPISTNSDPRTSQSISGAPRRPRVKPRGLPGVLQPLPGPAAAQRPPQEALAPIPPVAVQPPTAPSPRQEGRQAPAGPEDPG